ncbi:conserved Plasmodium protein, unknown function [Plasmodium ovale wallikeri]|uniref:Uncharacterized protein n=2 Tax=Plasmodium ovale TaxID=36330 RepID=A0A1A8ZR70_PLAOA|nr:conserved Plasmodium protein, unknown function [Plasmodium ovale wallikeri]SBT46376.1 conserved Plasmodium protein, unknown function [Plasmodium ovale wallikeri]SBT78910.1 conserved Plasmodium protein, unknown function [Plasmodium ovale]
MKRSAMKLKKKKKKLYMGRVYNDEHVNSGTLREARQSIWKEDERGSVRNGDILCKYHQEEREKKNGDAEGDEDIMTSGYYDGNIMNMSKRRKEKDMEDQEKHEGIYFRSSMGRSTCSPKKKLSQNDVDELIYKYRKSSYYDTLLRNNNNSDDKNYPDRRQTCQNAKNKYSSFNLGNRKMFISDAHDGYYYLDGSTMKVTCTFDKDKVHSCKDLSFLHKTRGSRRSSPLSVVPKLSNHGKGVPFTGSFPGGNDSNGRGDHRTDVGADNDSNGRGDHRTDVGADNDSNGRGDNHYNDETNCGNYSRGKERISDRLDYLRSSLSGIDIRNSHVKHNQLLGEPLNDVYNNDKLKDNSYYYEKYISKDRNMEDYKKSTSGIGWGKQVGSDDIGGTVGKMTREENSSEEEDAMKSAKGRKLLYETFFNLTKKLEKSKSRKRNGSYKKDPSFDNIRRRSKMHSSKIREKIKRESIVSDKYLRNSFSKINSYDNILDRLPTQDVQMKYGQVVELENYVKKYSDMRNPIFTNGINNSRKAGIYKAFNRFDDVLKYRSDHSNVHKDKKKWTERVEDDNERTSESYYDHIMDRNIMTVNNMEKNLEHVKKKNSNNIDNTSLTSNNIKSTQLHTSAVSQDSNDFSTLYDYANYSKCQTKDSCNGAYLNNLSKCDLHQGYDESPDYDQNNRNVGINSSFRSSIYSKRGTTNIGEFSESSPSATERMFIGGTRSFELNSRSDGKSITASGGRNGCSGRVKNSHIRESNSIDRGCNSYVPPSLGALTSKNNGHLEKYIWEHHLNNTKRKNITNSKHLVYSQLQDDANDNCIYDRDSIHNDPRVDSRVGLNMDPHYYRKSDRGVRDGPSAKEKLTKEEGMGNIPNYIEDEIEEDGKKKIKRESNKHLFAEENELLKGILNLRKMAKHKRYIDDEYYDETNKNASSNMFCEGEMGTSYGSCFKSSGNHSKHNDANNSAQFANTSCFAYLKNRLYTRPMHIDDFNVDGNEGSSACGNAGGCSDDCNREDYVEVNSKNSFSSLCYNEILFLILIYILKFIYYLFNYLLRLVLFILICLNHRLRKNSFLSVIISAVVSVPLFFLVMVAILVSYRSINQEHFDKDI